MWADLFIEVFRLKKAAVQTVNAEWIFPISNQNKLYITLLFCPYTFMAKLLILFKVYPINGS